MSCIIPKTGRAPVKPWPRHSTTGRKCRRRLQHDSICIAMTAIRRHLLRLRYYYQVGSRGGVLGSGMILGISASKVSEHCWLHPHSKVPNCTGDAWLRESHLKSTYVPPKQAISQAKKNEGREKARHAAMWYLAPCQQRDSPWCRGPDSRLTQVVFSICSLLHQVRVGRLHAPEDLTLNPRTRRGSSADVRHFSSLFSSCTVLGFFFSIAESWHSC